MGVGREGTGKEGRVANGIPLCAVGLVFKAGLARYRQRVITEDVARARVLGRSGTVFKNDSVSR